MKLLLTTGAYAAFLAQSSFAAVTATFNVDDQMGDPTLASDLNSIQVGSTIFTDLISPISYENVSYDGAVEIRDDTVTVSNLGDMNFETGATLAFQDRNLNHYQQIDTGNLGDQYRLNFSGIPSGADVFMLVTERNSNNPFFIEAFDSTDALLGSLVVDIADYVGTGAFSLSTDRSNTEEIGAIVYELSDIAPTGELSYLLVTNNHTGTDDGGDGKVFFFGDISTVPEPSSALLVGLGGIGILVRRRRSRSI